MSWVERLVSLLETSTFRHASLIAFIFLLVAGGSVLVSSRQIENLLHDHVRDMVLADIQGHQDRGLEGAAALASALAREDKREGSQALVLSAQGNVLFGHTGLERALGCPQHCVAGWHDTAMDGPDGQLMQMFGMLVTLADGGTYFSGYDILPMLERVRVIPLVAGSGLFAVLLTSLAIGLYSSLRSMRRVDHIRAALRRYASGDRKVTVPAGGSGDEFDLLGVDINYMLNRTNHLMDEVKSVSGHIAHELRTPLTRLHTRLVGAAERADAGVREEILAAVEEAERVQKLFRAVLRIGEIEAGRCAHFFEWFEPQALLDDVVDYYQPMAEDTGIRLLVQAPQALQLYGDRALLFQALANLLENAMKYAAGASAITLLVRATGQDVEVGVSDDGPGIPPEERSEAVKRFRRVGRNVQAQPGYGLGLALVSAIATLHGGTLALDDNPPRGLRAVLRLSHEHLAERSRGITRAA
ncbi:sensor histidine kinase [Uliginosibacterium sp. H1]|uniref:sensor histidine kinase n=1 Tax=Uliginosibacterium sp. H1 TaxID=3114757 RepID=UPI002E19568A|nr:HAMP domain-containing sensor histidine kinase [Uliginosibacterium sp. H1]